MAAEEKHSGYKEGLSSPADNAFAITPHDSNELAYTTRGLYVGVQGDVKVQMISGDTVTFVELAAGVIHPLRVKQVFNTGTAATNLVGVY